MHIAELCEGIRTGCRTATNEREDQRKCWYTSTCSEYVQKECVAYREVDLLKEVQGSEGQTTVQDAAEEYEIIYSKGDVVALKHNYKRYIILSSLQSF